MTKYLKYLPSEATFIQRGLRGYQYPIENHKLEMYRVDVEQGHDDFVRSSNITHLYYVLDGSGSFDVDGACFAVSSGNLVEIPAEHTFAYSGRMTLLLIMQPGFTPEAIEVVRRNPDVA